MLEHLVDRLKQVQSIRDIVLATTINGADSCLEEFARKNGIECFRGSEQDVMDRVIGAADSVDADIIVDITGDCPIIDPLIIEQTIQVFLHNTCDYASNCHIRSYPDGMDTQVFRIDTLKHSATLTMNPLDHEHVTLHIRNHPEIFKHINLFAPPDLYWPELGLTLDEKKDYELLKNLIEYFGSANPYFSCREVIILLKTKPEWIAINREVQRKGIS